MAAADREVYGGRTTSGYYVHGPMPAVSPLVRLAKTGEAHRTDESPARARARTVEIPRRAARRSLNKRPATWAGVLASRPFALV